MLFFIITVLSIALLLYVLLAGADFGAGILELFSSKKDFERLKNLTYKAIGPIWEVNHIWIILVIVIFFMGFPKIYAVFSTVLHIPLLIMLLGIIFRGTAFTFRHYDAIKDNSQRVYTRIFTISSFITPLFLGICAGAIASGRIDNQAPDFYGRFIAGWLNGFSFSVGIFTISICAYLAAVYMIGESEESDLRKRFINRARNANIATVLGGGLVLLLAWTQGMELFARFFNMVSIACFIIATLALPLLWRGLSRKKVWLPRFIAVFQVSAILLAWGAAQFPYIILLQNEDHLSFYNAAAPHSTLRSLTIALIVGVVVIIPMLAYLFRSFNKIGFSEQVDEELS